MSTSEHGGSKLAAQVLQQHRRRQRLLRRHHPRGQLLRRCPVEVDATVSVDYEAFSRLSSTFV
ncbi:hypothetical protein [Corynebacterium glutamicum]|uniref:hypothetical protein n=1 Tax=Corynebacterium glutamicum TaxID=1718 RepID=UPI0012DA0C9E|nr:hypothetical protein [Corynebacterium glutamicum]